jgi:hypothetical protein
MEPLDKLAELARAHWTKHEKGRAVVESALSPNVREPCIQRRVVCRKVVSVPVEKDYKAESGTEHLPTCEEYDGKLDTSLTCRLFAQRDLCGHLGVFPALLPFSIRMWRVEWGAWHVMGRRLIYANEKHENRWNESGVLAHPDRRDKAIRM